MKHYKKIYSDTRAPLLAVQAFSQSITSGHYLPQPTQNSIIVVCELDAAAATSDKPFRFIAIGYTRINLDDH
ncbi:MAG: hypothetical protein Kow0090_22230 [Myxococcota bacterium]